ncbi:MAG TPA: asparagine synthetase B, partial [Flavisolibacter sp.]|nr:asparagine synthetase B [Flavisolibacter sp.]
MCGIVGLYAFTESGKKFMANMDASNQMLSKRGPDGGSVYQHNKVTLGHRRLSIIDVSCAGDQPMHSMSGRFSIVFNGEFFNYQELRNRYFSDSEQKQLRSHSDTEVFLALYEKLGKDTFELLQGFFAAAIYDIEKEEIVLVRDRYGKKPLLIYQDDDKLLF